MAENEQNEKAKKEKMRMELTPNGVGGLSAASLFVADALAHFNPELFLVASIGTWVFARHTEDMLYLKDKVATKFFRPAQSAVSASSKNDEPVRQYSLGERLWGKHLAEDKKEEPAVEKQPNQDVKEPSLLRRLVGNPVARMVNLGPDLQLDINDIAGKATFICGIRRSGKTTLGVRIAEEMGKFNLPMLIPDLKGDWLSLINTLPNAVILRQGEATEKNARALGYSICEQRIQIIVDIASYDDMNEAARVIAGMIDGIFLWERKHSDNRTLCAVFLDEAQSFLPQDVKDSIISDTEARDALQNAYMRTIAIGGSLGLFPVIMTQRIAQTSNKVIGQPELLFLFKQTLDNDLKRYQNFTRISTEQVRALKQGQGVFVNYEGDSSIHMFHKRTSSDAMSRTPRIDTEHQPASKSVGTQLLDEKELEEYEEDRGYDEYEEDPLPNVQGAVKSTVARHESEDDRKIKRAFQHWQNGHASVRKLEAVSGWSNGETRRIIRLMKERKLIS